MAAYKFKIEEKDNGYIFVLYPNNSSHQEMGSSIKYSSKPECIKAQKKFINLVKNEKIDSDSSKFVTIKKNNNKWYFEYIYTNKCIFFRKMGYEKLINAKKAIKSIYTHICDM